MKRLLKLSMTLFLLLIFSYVYTDSPVTIEMFSPQGTVKKVRQARVRFSEQMVPFGDPRVIEDPFKIECSITGTGRWADGKNWTYDFEKDLPAGVKGVFTLKSGTRSLSGKEIQGQKEFMFSTGGPSIISTNPYKGSGYIDEEQVFILNLDAEPDEKSVLNNVFFSVEGIQDYINIKIIDGGERDNILQTQRRYHPYSQDEYYKILLKCRQTFPSDTNITLLWGKGVKSLSGVENTEDQILRYRTRKAFSVNCHCERENADADCIPMLPVRLYFSAPVSIDQTRNIVLKSESGKTWKPDPAEENKQEYINFVVFPGPFPESTDFTISIPSGLKDDSGRMLVNADKFPLSIRTDKYPPLAKFAARFGIIELMGDPALPVTVRNLEPDVGVRMLSPGSEGMVGKLIGKMFNVESRGNDIQEWIRRVGSAKRDVSMLKSESKAVDFKLPKISGTGEFEVVGIPLKEPGFYVVEIESLILGKSLLGKSEPMYVPAAALVTNMAVHLKKGRENSLVWVTYLNSGNPVPGADVEVQDCNGSVLWQGKTDSNGIAMINKSLPSVYDLPRCGYNNIGSGFFVSARLDKDFSFVFSSWNKGIESWRYRLPVEYYGDNDSSIVHTVFDRTLLRAGETVHMKHLMRLHTMKGFSYPGKQVLPEKLFIEHAGSNTKYELTVDWTDKGIAESSFKIPKDAKLGVYQLSFSKASGNTRRGYYSRLNSGSFRVEEFRVPLMKAVIKTSDKPLINADKFNLDVNVSYLSGGNAGFLPVKLRGEMRPKYINNFEGFDDFSFATGMVKEEITRGGRSFDYDYEDDEYGDGGDEFYVRDGISSIPAIEATLDKSGGTRIPVRDIPKSEKPMEAVEELEFMDPNGELQTVSSVIPLWTSEYVIGIKPDSWALSMDKVKFHVAVLDITGKPAANAPVKLQMFSRKIYSHRKRVTGGFYSYEYVAEIKKIADIAGGRTDRKGLFIAEARSPVSGNIILQAESEDRNGNRTITHTEAWIGGKGEWWYEVSDNDRIDLLPEKKRYEPGETAVFQVRMPFRNATALVTVEREGVIESSVEKLSGKMPVIKIPIKGNYAPNCFVSALVVRGRVSGVQPTAMVDMGRPAYKLGISEIKVGWRSHELKVKVIPERKVYRTREKARVKITVRSASGKIPPAGTEVSVAAVDEGLLELMPNRSWNILQAMMGQRPYEIETSSAQMQVVGRRHFGLKALPHGGGGGRQITRELFDTLLLWKGRAALDGKGEASVTIPLNDSVTGFRIAAVADGGRSFGYGDASIKATQDIMILSGLPPVVREGDEFKAEFTVRNTTDREIELEASVKASGLKEKLDIISVKISGGEARDISWDINVPVGIDKINWEADIREKTGGRRDAIKISQKVVPAVPVSTYQATIAQIDKKFSLSVEKPEDAIPGRGGLRITLKPRISEVQKGVTDYMKNYPYSCMEQKVSIAVALRNEKYWDSAMSGLSSYMDRDGLVKYFPSCREGSPVLTSYIIAIGNEAGWDIPENNYKDMKAALRKFVEGSIVRYSSLRTVDLTFRKLSAIEALSRSGDADPGLTDSIQIEPNLWPTSAVIDWYNILMNMESFPQRDAGLREAEQILRSRLNFQGTKMGFSTENGDYLWWLMISGDVNSVRLILSAIGSGTWNDDMPRLVLGAIARQHRGTWNLTTANAWGVLALEKFSQLYESAPVTGSSVAGLSSQSGTADWKTADVKPIMLKWPEKSKPEELTIDHQGEGKPWAIVQSLAAIPLKKPLSSGFKIKKTIKAVEQKDSGKWNRGDIFRVKIEIESQADQTWVVVSDPVPACVSIIGKGMARDSQILMRGEEAKGMAWPAYEERSFEAYRAYYEYVAKGKWSLEYTIRVNQSGTFRLPPTRVEALYFPEMFGEIPNKTIEVVK